MMKILKSLMKNQTYKVQSLSNINNVMINKKNKTTMRRRRMREEEEKTRE